MTTPEDDEARGGLARRKLIRGAFAAPAALTLFSGSAAAATSNVTCMATQNARPSTMSTAATTSATADRYWRYQLWALVVNFGRAVDSYYIKGGELAAFVRLGQTPFLTSAQWQRFDLTNNVLTGSALSAAPSKAGYTLKQVQQYVVLRVDSAGKVVGAGSAGPGAPLSGSCWTSFATSAKP